MYKVPFRCDDSGSWKLIAYYPWKWCGGSVPILFLSRIAPPCEKDLHWFFFFRTDPGEGKFRTVHMVKNACVTKYWKSLYVAKFWRRLEGRLVLRKKLAQFAIKCWHLMENSQCRSPVYLVNRITPWWTRKFNCGYVQNVPDCSWLIFTNAKIHFKAFTYKYIYLAIAI